MARELLAPTWCWWPVRRGEGKCQAPAGRNTNHPGYGPCRLHEPTKMRTAWRYAVRMAQELNVSPWDALTKSVRIAAARVEWVDGELARLVAANDGGEPTEMILELMEQSRKERTLMARSAKAAIDAGVAERLVRQVELEGRVLADALEASLTAIGASEDQRLVALEAAHRTLVATVQPDGSWNVSGTPSPPTGSPLDATGADDLPRPEDGTGGFPDGEDDGDDAAE